MHASASTLKPLNAVFHSALRFITGDRYLTHHCILYEKVGWPSLEVRREQHCLLFIYKALCGKLPLYLTSLLKLCTSGYNTRSQTQLRLHIPRMKCELGKTAFSFYAPDRWNRLQESLKLDNLVSIESFKVLLDEVFLRDQSCSCYF